MKTLKRIFLSSMIAISFCVLTGCGTISGAGQDIQHVGKAVTKAAN